MLSKPKIHVMHVHYFFGFGFYGLSKLSHSFFVGWQLWAEKNITGFQTECIFLGQLVALSRHISLWSENPKEILLITQLICTGMAQSRLCISIVSDKGFLFCVCGAPIIIQPLGLWPDCFYFFFASFKHPRQNFTYDLVKIEDKGLAANPDRFARSFLICNQH